MNCQKIRVSALASIAIAAFSISLSSSPVHAQENADSFDETIVVTGQRGQQIRAIEVKRDALGIVDVASADEIGRLPDRNVAEVVERLPGVGVQYDQGEGRFVSVRGVPSALNGYTLNGFEIGNPDGGTRALPLDVISGQLLNRVEVRKVKTPDLLGQGIGGTINLVQQTAFDFDAKTVLFANAQVGQQQLRDDSHPVSGDITFGTRFGPEESFGILLGASYSDRTFTSYGFFPDDWFEFEGAVRGGIPTNIKYTDYRLSRERIGFAGSIDWRGEIASVYARAVYSRFTEDEYRQRFRLDFSDGAVFDANGVTGTSDDTEQRSDLRLEYKEKSILSGMVGGSVEGESWQLDLGGAISHNEVIEPNQVWQFRGNPGDVSFDFTDKLYTVVPVDGYAEPSDLGFRSYAVQDQTGEEDILQVRGDFTLDMDWGDESFAKAGVNVRSLDKKFDDESISYTRGSTGNRFSLDGLAGPDVTVTPRAGRDYLISPVIDEDLIRAFTAENLDSALFVLDEEGTLADQVLSDFDIGEDIYAAYVMADANFGTFGLTAGLRVERTEIDATGFTLENETDVVAAGQEYSYTDWLPSIVARITPREDVILRLAYSRTVGRPEYGDLSPGGSLEYLLVDEDVYEGSLSLGNAALKPYRSQNADLSAEWYFAPGGLVSIAGFAKWIDDPIFASSFTQTDVTFGGRFYETLEFSQPQNASKGEVYGIELAYQHQFTGLPGLLSGLGVNANVTFIDSKIDVPGRGEADFPEQSDLLYGVQLFYQKGIVEASVAYNHTGRALIGIAGDPLEDQFNDDLRRLDAKFAIDLTENFRVFVQGQNLTDEATRQYQGGRRDWVIQRERYGRTFWLGVTARL